MIEEERARFNVLIKEINGTEEEKQILLESFRPQSDKSATYKRNSKKRQFKKK